MKWINEKIVMLELLYAKQAEAWKNETDDRRIFSNTFYMWVSALDGLQKDPEIMIKVAINNSLREDMQMLDRILERFAE